MFRKRLHFVVPCAALLLSLLLAFPSFVNAQASSSQGVSPPLLNAPPLFTTSGHARDVTAIVGGLPQAVRLVVQGGSSTTMQRGDGLEWHGQLPADVPSGTDHVYSVIADYTDGSVVSDAAHLYVLDDVTTITPSASTVAGQTLLNIDLTRGLLGVTGGTEGATIIPPSFALDEVAKRLLVLDAVKSQVVSFDAGGSVRKRVALSTKSRTASDIVMDTSDRSALVLDQPKDTVLRLGKGKQSVLSAAGAHGAFFGDQLTFDGRNATTFLRDGMQGRLVPLVVRGRKATATERSQNAQAGAASPVGSVAAEIEDHAVTFGVLGSRYQGLRIEFADQVLDASDVLVDGQGTIWGLVGLYNGSTDTASTRLIALDAVNAVAKALGVPTYVPGDVTRRLAAAKSGVVMLQGARDALRYVRFNSL